MDRHKIREVDTAFRYVFTDLADGEVFTEGELKLLTALDELLSHLRAEFHDYRPMA